MKTNPRPTTIGGWINLLPEDIREKALQCAMADDDGDQEAFEVGLRVRAIDMAQALSRAFVWADTKDGHKYWHDVATDKNYIL